MKLYYLSEARFMNRIVKSWDKKGFPHNAGHRNILRFAFRTVQYWSNLERQRVSKLNQFDTSNLTLF
jgi:hypothetical protein